MILSMTGFGRGTAVRNGREITVELRSVNSRYFEYSSRMPRTCSYMDSRLKKQLNEQITRGKVELSLTVQNVDAADTVVTVNRELARSYQQALRDLSEELCIKNDTSASLIARFPDVLATRHADVDEEQLWEDVSAVTAQALETFVQMRAAEGAKMHAATCGVMRRLTARQRKLWRTVRWLVNTTRVSLRQRRESTAITFSRGYCAWITSIPFSAHSRAMLFAAASACEARRSSRNTPQPRAFAFSASSPPSM